MTARPWRAAAYYAIGGAMRHYMGHTSAKTRDGLDRFVDRHTAQGCTVDVWQVMEHPDVAALVTQASASDSE